MKRIKYRPTTLFSLFFKSRSEVALAKSHVKDDALHMSIALWIRVHLLDIGKHLNSHVQSFTIGGYFELFATRFTENRSCRYIDKVVVVLVS